MKYCIDCGRNNGKNKLLFEGAQCVDCYNHNPIVLVQVPVVSIKIVPVKEKKEIVRCECGRPIKSGRDKCFKCYNRDNFGEVKIKKVKMCFVCDLPEDENNLFRRYERAGIKCVYSQHIGCSDRKYELLGSRIRVKKIRIKDIRKRGRPLGGSSISERVFNLPDKKVCVGCEEEKLITDYYTRNGLPYAQCKKCHKKRCKEWESNNKEKISVYYKEYQKNYVRKSKRMLKINLPPNGI
jgi:hypothetical protein